MDLSLQKIGQLLTAPIQGVDVKLTGVTFDSRQVKAGDLFVALVADHDGHDYIQQALAAGAGAVMVDQQHSLDPNVPAVIVPDTLLGLQQLGQAWQERINPRVVAITGSNGKTTTKDMVAAILATKYKTHKTPANFNNEIGVPMTLLDMPVDTEMLVVELGMDRPGQLTALSNLVKPDLAVITMIGEAHIEFFKTRQRIAQAKLEIIAGLKPGGALLIPFDEPLLTKAQVPVSKLIFGGNATEISSQQKETSFSYEGVRFAIPLLGRYNIMNALAAIRVGQLFQVALTQAQVALREFNLTANRMEYLKNPQGVIVISDVYNANPTAVKAALKAIDAVNASRKYVVLGDMLELGSQGSDFHAQLAPAVLAAKLDGVYLVGPLMTENLAPRLALQMASERIHCYPTVDLTSLYQDLVQQLEPTDVVLLKGSHGIHLEQVVNQLMTP